GVGGGVGGPAGLGGVGGGGGRAGVDDPLAVLAGDGGPVVGVGGVGQVLVLAELVDAGGEEVVDAESLLAGVEVLLDGHLLGAVDDVLDHRAGVEVLEVEDFLVAVGVGDLEEAALLGFGVQALDGRLAHGLDG